MHVTILTASESIRLSRGGAGGRGPRTRPTSGGCSNAPPGASFRQGGQFRPPERGQVSQRLVLGPEVVRELANVVFVFDALAGDAFGPGEAGRVAQPAPQRPGQQIDAVL